MAQRPARRRKITHGILGEVTEDDERSSFNLHHKEIESLASTRFLPSSLAPSLVSLAAKSFVLNIRILSSDGAHSSSWKRTKRLLALIPDHLVHYIFWLLQTSVPTLLNNAFITAFFIKGPKIVITSRIPRLSKATLNTIGNGGQSLRHLELSELSDFPDLVFASVLKGLRNLIALVLRGSTKVGPLTSKSAAENCANLKIVNFNYTNVTTGSLVHLLVACQDLEVLKLAGVSGVTDANIERMIRRLAEEGITILPHLSTLKLRHTHVSSIAVSLLINMCPNLRRVDLGFTLLRRLSIDTPATIPPLRKLSLTSTGISAADLLAIIEYLPRIETLCLGALSVSSGGLGGLHGSSSGMILDNATLLRLTDILASFEQLKHISLVGNSKLGVTEDRDEAMRYFISTVGRKCLTLNLSSIPSLSSNCLLGFITNDGESRPMLQTLNLNNTRVCDLAVPLIANCTSLTSLSLQRTTFTKAGLLDIIEACPKLVSIDLTSCRSVALADRRRIFEVWREDRGL